LSVAEERKKGYRVRDEGVSSDRKGRRNKKKHTSQGARRFQKRPQVDFGRKGKKTKKLKPCQLWMARN